MGVVASERASEDYRREAADKTLDAKVYAQVCAAHKDIRFPIDRATKHTCRDEPFFCWLASLYRSLIVNQTDDRPWNWRRSLSSFFSSRVHRSPMKYLVSLLERVPPLAASQNTRESSASVKDAIDWVGPIYSSKVRNLALHERTRATRTSRYATLTCIPCSQQTGHATHTQSCDRNPTWMNTVK